MKPTDLTMHELTCPHCQKRLAYVPPIDRFPLVHGPDAAQALADVRALDEWADANPDLDPFRTGRGEPTDHDRWCCWTIDCPGKRKYHYGPTPDAARHAAAEWVRGQK